jgi:hypothetical protein
MLDTFKKCYKSRTIIFSFALVVFGALEAGFPYLQSVIDAKYYGVILVSIGITTAILRFITTGPLK